MAFEFRPTSLEGLFLITPRSFPDDRGWFQEAYKRTEFVAAGITETFVQDNLSNSSCGTLRGLHYQRDPSAQGKLVQVLRGAVWDVAVDIRHDSPTFGQWYGVELNSINRRLFYIPAGFAHGFVALTDDTLFSYKCTNEYDKKSEGGILWSDKDLAIEWPIIDISVSQKDAILPGFNSISVKC